LKKYHLVQKDYDAKMHSKPAFQIFLRKLFGLLIQIVFSNKMRTQLARSMGVKVGKNIYIGKYCIIDDTFSDLITIEDNVVISFGTTITAHDASCNKIAPVVLKKGAFIGARSIVLPGVTLAENSIVGAGSVVTRDVSPGKIVSGCPAKVMTTNIN
jgi:acetyltransferase-like isoleucine patch superfamily enzyme